MKKHRLIFNTIALVLGLFLHAPAFADGLEDQANKLRLLIADLIESSASAHPEEKLRQTFVKEGSTLLLFLDPEILSGISNLAELPTLQIPWEKIGKSLSDSIFTSIQDILNREHPILNDTSRIHPLTLKTTLFIFSQISENKRSEILSQVPASVFVLLGKQIRTQMRDLQFTALPWVARITDTRYFSGRSEEDQSNQATKMILKDYFELLPLDLKSSMAVDYLRTPLGSSFATKIGGVLNAVNPIVQKLFQLLGKKLKDPDLALAMEQLQDSLRPIPFEQIKTTYETRTGKKWEDSFKDTDTEHMKRATTGQVVFATLRATGKRVAIKTRIPGIRENYRQGREQLLKLPSVENNIGVKNTFLSLIGKIEEEIDYRLESQITDAVQPSYTRPELGIIPLSRASPKDGIYEDLIVYNFAAGKKGSDLITAETLPLRAKLTKNLLEVWVQSAFFDIANVTWEFAGDYPTVFHGDLHSGNYVIDLPSKTLTVLDFGNVGVFPMEMRRSFVQLFVASLDATPDRFLNTIQELFPFSVDKQVLARSAVQQSWDEFSSPLIRVESAISRLVEGVGVQIPGSISSLIRALEFLRREVDDINERLEVLGHSFDKYQIDFSGVMVKVFLKQLSHDWWNSAWSKNQTTPTLIPISLLRDALVLYLGSRFSNLCSALFSGSFFKRLPSGPQD